MRSHTQEADGIVGNDKDDCVNFLVPRTEIYFLIVLDAKSKIKVSAGL